MQVLGHGYVACTSRICGVVGRGFWMPKLRVVVSRVCGTGIGFRLVNKRLFGRWVEAILVRRERIWRLGSSGFWLVDAGFLPSVCGWMERILAVKGHVLNDTVTLLPGDAFCCHRVRTAHPASSGQSIARSWANHDHPIRRQELWTTQPLRPQPYPGRLMAPS